MSLTVSHNDALRIASRTGAMFRALYGRPFAVVGIERGGTVVAEEFARAAGAKNCVLVRQRRSTSVGWRGRARTFLQRTTSIGLRRIYRQIFFKLIVRASRRFSSGDLTLDPAAREKLEALVTRFEGGTIVVVDDAIDSGGTVSRVLASLNETVPGADVVLFSLTTTARIRVARQQINAFADILEFNEGDLGELSDDRRASAEWGGADSDGDPLGDREPSLRHLYLDLDGTLVRDSFRTARDTLQRFLIGHFMWLQASKLLLANLLKKLRLIDHQTLKILIDDLIVALPPGRGQEYQDRLSDNLDLESRWTLAAVSRAPGVRSRIVTTALASYSQAIEKALGIPVLVASGRDADGDWREVDSEAKVASIRADRTSANVDETPCLFIGDTIVDALATAEGITVAIIPTWDETGLLTLLGSDSWWTKSNRPHDESATSATAGVATPAPSRPG